MGDALQNWARNFTFAAARVHSPRSAEDVRDLVARTRKIRALGTRHSFNDIADTTEDLVSLERLDRVVSFDLVGPRPTVTIEAGVTYGRLCPQLHARGYALHNLASLPHISVAGACATATHGSGERNGNLATAVAAIELVTAGGSLGQLSRDRDGDTFAASVVGLGGLGVITKVTLDVVPAFEMAQEVYENLPFAALDANFDAIQSAGYSVSLFTDWRTDRVNQVWVKRRVSDGQPTGPDPTALGATRATRNLHPLADLSAENCTAQLGQPGPWHERLPHFRMDFTPSSGEELQSEYFVPREHAVAALHAVNAMREAIAPHLQISEIRTIAADDLWMSLCYGQHSCAIHFTWRKDWPAVRQILPQIEQALAPFNPRPHWGKLFTVPAAELQRRYPKLEAFRDLLHAQDPRGKFRNGFLNRYLFAP
jgi:xylitol oxidase